MRVLHMNIKVVQKNKYMGIRVICTLLFVLSILRYLTLLLFARASSMEILIKMQPFYFITSMSIPVAILLLLWYITPLYRTKINQIGIIILCIPWVIFYILLLIFKPYEIIKSQKAGYILKLIYSWDYYLAALQGISIFIFILAALYGFMLYKHQQTRSQYMILVMCLLLFLADGLIYFGLSTPMIPVFTLTEVLGFLGIYYGFLTPPIDARGVQR